MKFRKKRIWIYILLFLMQLERILCPPYNIFANSSLSKYDESFSFNTTDHIQTLLHRSKREACSNDHDLGKDRNCYTTSYKFGYLHRGNVKGCVTRCWQHRHMLAMLRQGKWCNCLMSIQKARKVDPKLCNQKCEDTPLENCGGSEAYTVYKTGYKPEPNYRYQRMYAFAVIKRYKKGCFRYPPSPQPRQMVFFTLRMTPSLCIAECRKHKHNFAGVFQGWGCLCLHSLNMPQVSLETCSKFGCEAANKQPCGGPKKEVLVYKARARPSGNNLGTSYNDKFPVWMKPVFKCGGYNYFTPKKEPKKFRPSYNPQRSGKGSGNGVIAGGGRGSQGGRQNHGGRGSQGGRPNKGGRGSQGGRPNKGGRGSQGGRPNKGGRGSQGGRPNKGGRGSQGGRPNKGGRGSQGGRPNKGGRGSQGGKPNKGGRGSQGGKQNQGQPNSKGSKQENKKNQKSNDGKQANNNKNAPKAAAQKQTNTETHNKNITRIIGNDTINHNDSDVTEMARLKRKLGVKNDNIIYAGGAGAVLLILICCYCQQQKSKEAEEKAQKEKEDEERRQRRREKKKKKKKEKDGDE